MYDLDPKVFGPGTWTVLHIIALLCDESGTPEDFKSYCQLVYRITHALPCTKCRAHAVKYFDKNKIPTVKAEGSLFAWSVAFHNAVNKRLQKPIMPLSEAYAIYSNTEVILTNKDTSATCKLSSSTMKADEAAGGCEDASL